jgi:hypothetical protein
MVGIAHLKGRIQISGDWFGRNHDGVGEEPPVKDRVQLN